jgi:hypothetical protein
MPAATPGWSAQCYAALSRMVLISIGVFSVWWGVSTFPIFWRDARLDYTAASITGGEPFKRENLETLLAAAESTERVWARPESLRSLAIIRLCLAEQSSIVENAKPSGPDIDQFGASLRVENAKPSRLVLDQLDASIRRSLSAAPADPFLWLALFWSETMKDDWSKKDFAYLRMSYLVGPHEGWVAVRRNYIALENFSALPQDLAAAAVTEFKNLVKSHFDTAVTILVGPGWPIHDMLLGQLADAPQEAREQFARSAYHQLGYDIAVPGVERPDPRPWR